MVKYVACNKPAVKASILPDPVLTRRNYGQRQTVKHDLEAAELIFRQYCCVPYTADWRFCGMIFMVQVF